MPLNVLIVENESIIALDIKQRLSSIEYTVIGAVYSGEEALDIIKNNVIDLVFMDVSLDGKLDGVDTAVLIRANFDMPIIYISASFNLEMHDNIKQTEPYEYVKKPFDDDQFQVAITNCFKH